MGTNHVPEGCTRRLTENVLTGNECANALNHLTGNGEGEDKGGDLLKKTALAFVLKNVFSN